MIYRWDDVLKIVEQMSGSHNDDHQARQQLVPPL
jgi:hypothetical protein